MRIKNPATLACGVLRLQHWQRYWDWTTAHWKITTITAVTGRGGRHYVFKYPRGRSIPNKTKFAPGFDNHSTGGLIVVAPSIHVSDNQYQWLKGHSSFDKTLAEAPEWLLKLMEREEVLLTPFEGRSIVAGIKEGSRNSTLTSLAGTMRARGMTEEGIYTALLAENNARCNPPLDEAEIKKIYSLGFQRVSSL